MKITWLSNDKVIEFVKTQVFNTSVVLDIGCGIQPQTFIKPDVHICVEPHLEYIEKIKNQAEQNQETNFIFFNCSWQEVIKNIPDKSVDSVFALDVIEHLEKKEGFELLKEAERIARKQVMIYTPLGFYPQSYEDPEKLDRWGMKGGYWQTHRSGWNPEDFGEDWQLICCEAYHFADENDQPLEKPFGAIWAFRNLVSYSNYPNKSQKLLTQSPKIVTSFVKKVVRKIKQIIS